MPRAVPPTQLAIVTAKKAIWANRDMDPRSNYVHAEIGYTMPTMTAPR